MVGRNWEGVTAGGEAVRLKGVGEQKTTAEGVAG